MKLLNYSTTYFAIPLLLILTVWAGLFYVAMLDEIYDSIGDVLESQKMVVIEKAATDSTVLKRAEFADGYYMIRETTPEKAIGFKDRFTDTLMFLQVEEDYEPIRMLTTMFTQNGRYYELRVVTSMVEEDDLINELINSLVWLYAGLLATILLLNNFILKRIWRPFYVLLQRLQKFRLEEPAPLKLPETKVDEFRMLNETVATLLESNTNTYLQQKQFIENAAHELQTPLAISLGKLETLAEEAPLTQEQATLLSSALSNLERMTRLNKALLLLSRIQNRQFTEVKKLNLRTCAEEVLADLQDQFEHQHITVTITEDEPCTKIINPDLCTILFLNLIKNALVHNYPGGFLKLHFSKRFVSLENSGQPKALDGKAIFTRFYKGNAHAASTGLGLALVQEIARISGFKVSYVYNSHYIFRLDL